jgi:DNA-binding XRE family transcriptional regulator
VAKRTITHEQLANLEALANGLNCYQEGPTMITHRKPIDKILWFLAANCRRLRTARGYTQEDLARLCGFTASYIGDVEQETVNITLANLETLAKGLVA